MTAFVIANWKMNKSLRESSNFMETFRTELQKFSWKDKGSIGIAPPFPFLEAISDRCHELGIRLGGQNAHECNSGAFTGEVAAPMLKDLGCSFVIVGHSERRAQFGESSELVVKKAVGVLQAGMTPVICIGETLAERDSGKTFDVIRSQLQPVLLEKAILPHQMILAYEPVWAIGTGKTATPEIAQEVHRYIRGLLVECYGNDVARAVPILYGGSVKSSNILSLVAEQDIDGGLVGGASLDPMEFALIVKGAMTK